MRHTKGESDSPLPHVEILTGVWREEKEMARITCRDHGGTFERPVRRGRPPVRCSDDNMCSKHPDVKVIQEAPARGRKGVVKPGTRRTKAPLTPTKAQRDAAAVAAAKAKALSEPLPKALQVPVKTPRKAVEPSAPANPSVPMALAAKALLEPQGWTCHATTPTPVRVEFHASRGTERLALVWENGEPISQDYTLFDTEKLSANGIPAGKRKLPFDPDEMTDSELVKALSGMTVVWWNRIAQGEERATLPSKVQITHTFNGTGDEVPGDRVVTFVDVHGGGFRSFRAGALMRLGK